MSSKGQVIIPKAIRESHRWRPGTEFVVKESSAGIVLTPRKPFPSTRLEDGLGCAGYTGPAKTVAEMDEGIAAELRGDLARGGRTAVIAVDTKVLVRYVTNDDPEQERRALELLGRDEEVFVARTMLLEAGWVLRTVYGIPQASVRRALLHVLGLPNVQAEAPEQVAPALQLHERGLDFAHALHLASGGEAEAFPTFVGELAGRGRSLVLPVRLL